MEEICKKYKLEIETFVFTLVIFFLAHSNMFVHNSFSHDSLLEYAGAIEHKIGLGRFIQPIYQEIFRTHLGVAFIIGLLGFVFLFISSIAIIKIFDINNRWAIFFVCATMTTNITVISNIATYINDFDVNMFGVMCSILAVYFWYKTDKWYLGSVFVAISLGIYQAFISITLSLFIMIFVIRMLRGAKLKDGTRLIYRAIIVVLIGSVLYVFIGAIVSLITDIKLTKGEYNSLTKSFEMSPSIFVSKCIEAYIFSCYKMIQPIGIVSRDLSMLKPFSIPVVARVVVLIVAIGVGIKKLLSKDIDCVEKIAITIGTTVLPFVMNISHALSGMSHDLMYYAVYMIYIFASVVIIENRESTTIKKNIKNKALLCILFVLVWNNIVISNTLYLKKIDEQNANLSLMTRLLSSIETLDSYKHGETQIVFVGTYDYLLTTPKEFEEVSRITGAESPNVLGSASRDYVAAYFEYVLRSNAKIVDKYKWKEYNDNPKFNDMPPYPSKGSIQIVDEICVVKFISE